MRALIYTRVSLDAREGRSTTEQEAECRAWATREGWTVTRVITETGSASSYARSTRARTRWTDVTTAIASGDHDILLTWEASRATRQLDEYAQLRALCAAHDVLWGYSGTIYDLTDRGDRFRTGLDTLLSEDESARMSERIRRAVRARAREGRPHGKLPYGYRREYDPTTGHLLRQVPDETTAPVVRDIYARVIAGDTLMAIANDLTDTGVTPPRPPSSRHDRPQAWLSITVRRIAMSPTYAGRRTHQGQVIGPAAWPAIVDEDTWQQAVAILSAPGRRHPSPTTVKYLLTGIARCGPCGQPLKHFRNRNRWGTYACGQRGCYAVAITAPQLDNHVNGFMTALLAAHADQLHALADGTPSTEATEATDELEALRSRLAGFVAEATAGRLSPATLSSIEADLAPQIAAAEARVRATLVPSVLRGLDLDAPDPWGMLDLAQARRFIRDLIDITILPAGKGNWGRRTLDEERVRITPRW
ncbi:recombinase family protein [Ornithinimicrobium sufpigmenti]|uniref:recombinase family protein n=2 Tax=Ornithinimicrobium sufpigmenti TaxID=2508882 RepID=UPI00103576F5|nr:MULTISPECIES: recombinase family protein [unclassified Ornithinimicrobium]